MGVGHDDLTRTASLLAVDPAEGEIDESPIREPGVLSTDARVPWGKPRRTDALPDPPSGITVSEIPDSLLPAPPPDAADLVHVGDVCGQQIYARRDVVAKAKELGDRLKANREYWPSDALHATILALRMGLKPRPSYRQIAEMLHMSERHVLRTVRRGKKDTIVEKEIARLDSEGMPIAVENVLEGLEARDKDYTLEYLKGRGVLKQRHETVQDPNAGTPAFAGLVVQFVHDGSAPKEIRAGAIVASPNRALAPAVIDAEKV